MLRHTIGLALALATLACAVSCGSDSEDANTNTNPNTQDAGGIGCGAYICQLPEGVTEGEPCCKEQFLGLCGVRRMAGGSCGDLPIPPHPTCPSVMLPGGFGNLPSCCTSGNQCGILPPAIFGGGGCIELGEAQRRANEMIGDSGFSITFPAPQGC